MQLNEMSMKNKKFAEFYILSLIGVLIACFYPLYMGFRVISDMIEFGTVFAETYPKYIIPYTPISIALIAGVILMPIFYRYAKRYAQLSASVLCLVVFFGSELLLESLVIVTTTVQTTLESWQMAMCYQTPEMMGITTEVSILMGQYSPAFKMHFYLISVVLILALLNSFYGFGCMIQSGDKSRVKPLILQAVSAVLFLGLCIFACFTAFFRTGEILVSPISAVLMCIFFIVFGVTAGIFTGSFLYEKRKRVSVGIPSVVAIATAILMYIGELILLSGHLYRFGTGFPFSGIPAIVLAPVDLMVIAASGLLTAGIMHLIKEK